MAFKRCKCLHCRRCVHRWHDRISPATGTPASDPGSDYRKAHPFSNWCWRWGVGLHLHAYTADPKIYPLIHIALYLCMTTRVYPVCQHPSCPTWCYFILKITQNVVKKSNNFTREISLSFHSNLSRNRSQQAHSRGCIQNLLEPATKPTRQHARLLRLRRLHATRRPETRHARRSGAAQLADDLSSPSPPHIPPAEPLHHSNPPHRPGSNFTRISCRNVPFCSFWGA